MFSTLSDLEEMRRQKQPLEKLLEGIKNRLSSRDGKVRAGKPRTEGKSIKRERGKREVPRIGQEEGNGD